MWKIKSCSVSLGEAAKKLASFSFEDLEPRKDGMSPHWPCEGVVSRQCRAHCKYTLRSLELSLNMSLLCLAKEQWRRYETPWNLPTEVKILLAGSTAEKPRVWWTLGHSNMASWSLKLLRPHRSNMISQILKVAHCRLFQNMSVCTNASAFQSAYSQISGPV